jgi:hypothetical protein
MKMTKLSYRVVNVKTCFEAIVTVTISLCSYSVCTCAGNGSGNKELAGDLLCMMDRAPRAVLQPSLSGGSAAIAVQEGHTGGSSSTSGIRGQEKAPQAVVLQTQCQHQLTVQAREGLAQLEPPSEQPTQLIPIVGTDTALEADASLCQASAPAGIGPTMLPPLPGGCQSPGGGLIRGSSGKSLPPRSPTAGAEALAR